MRLRRKSTSGDAVAVQTPWQIALKRLRRHRMAIFGFRVLVVLYVLTVFAGFFAPYHYDNEQR